MATAQLSPLEQERNEFGYDIEDIRDRRLRIVQKGPEVDADTCLFFVHGGGGRACQFKHQIRAFQEEANVIGIDFLGHGDSPAPNNPALYTADEHLKDLKEVFMRFKKQRNYIVAHCYGALHTIRLLKLLKDDDQQSDHLSSITGVILLALGDRCPITSSWFTSIPSTILEWLRPLARSSSNAAIFTPETDPQLIQFENAISNNNRMYVMKVLAGDCCDSARWESWKQEAREVIIGDKIPVMMIAGESDGVYPPNTCQEFCTLMEIPDERFHVVTDVGHLMMLEKPDVVTRLIKEFIAADQQSTS